MPTIKPSEMTKSTDWKDVARLFYDFESGEIYPLAHSGAISEVAIQMGICARLFQNGFEEDANVVWQRMVSHETGEEHCWERNQESPILDDSFQEGRRLTATMNTSFEQLTTLRDEPVPKKSLQASEGTKDNAKQFLEYQQTSELSEFDLFGTERSAERETTLRTVDLNTHSRMDVG
ncbi:unnamed protein product [Agarophyton chilense]